MGFKSSIREDEIYKRTGIAKPKAQDYLMDFMAVAPMLMGMPMAGMGAGGFKKPLKVKPKLPKPGDFLKTPHGKVRFDGTWDDMPDFHQYTFQEGAAKGATFIGEGAGEKLMLEKASKTFEKFFKQSKFDK